MKEYLGDGVYVEDSGFDYILTTENGIEASNTIVVDVQIVKVLNKFIEQRESTK